jgi:hypothetical protein
MLAVRGVRRFVPMQITPPAFRQPFAGRAAQIETWRGNRMRGAK